MLEPGMGELLLSTTSCPRTHLTHTGHWVTTLSRSPRANAAAQGATPTATGLDSLTWQPHQAASSPRSNRLIS